MTPADRRDRDRDAAGRARNARPRDALGRPLPYGSADVPRQPEAVRRTAQQTLDEAQRLLDAGLPFHAHEVFEDAWKLAPEAERALWKGLAQLAVGLTHVARGNTRGARTLLRRGAAAIAPFAGGGRPQAPGLADLDITGLLDWTAGWDRELSEREAGRAADRAPEDPRDGPTRAPSLRVVR